MNISKVRARVMASISPQAADAAGMSFAELQGFIAGWYYPTERQLFDLARFIKMRVEETHD